MILQQFSSLKTDKREEGIERLIENFDITDFKSKNIALKANFNSADPFPASTHPDTLRTLVKSIKKGNLKIITLQREVEWEIQEMCWKTMGIMDIAEEEDFEVRILDEEGC